MALILISELYLEMLTNPLGKEMKDIISKMQHFSKRKADSV